MVNGNFLFKAGEIALDPILRSKYYCQPYSFEPGKWEFGLYHGTDPAFVYAYESSSPLHLLRHNIPLSVFNAVLAFLSLMLGICGEFIFYMVIQRKTNYIHH